MRFTFSLLLLALLAGCSQDEQPGDGRAPLTTDHDIFAGLPVAVAKEAVEEPAAASKFLQGNETDSMQMAQARALDYVGCRSSYEAYLEWKKTGQTPNLAPLPKPTGTFQGGYEYMNKEHEERRTALANGDVNRFLELLAGGQPNCAENIPVKYQDYNGPKIMDALARHKNEA